MTKQDIVNNVAKEINQKPKDAKPLVEEVFNCLKSNLESGINIEISGFGKFIIRKKNKRLGRNPMTGDKAEITARKVVTFKPSKLLRDSIND
ncbi:MAG: integration host factor subunit alpha [Candidatus Schekmanbacteria bacterium]|nr:integration host factor subunit alpha [Candidatus Schekmanbacteria bacterium]